MIKDGFGVIMSTGNTGSHRGKVWQTGFAPTKTAQRIFMEAMARDIGPQGVHVCFITIDALIKGTPGENMRKGDPEHTFITPKSIAEEAFHLAHQNKDAWTFDLWVRPHVETW